MHATQCHSASAHDDARYIYAHASVRGVPQQLTAIVSTGCFAGCIVLCAVESFKIFDLDRNGRIHVDEFRKIMTELGAVFMHSLCARTLARCARCVHSRCARCARCARARAGCSVEDHTGIPFAGALLSRSTEFSFTRLRIPKHAPTRSHIPSARYIHLPTVRRLPSEQNKMYRCTLLNGTRGHTIVDACWLVRVRMLSFA